MKSAGNATIELLRAQAAPDLLREMAGARSYKRGEKYFAGGFVLDVKLGDDAVEACVQGSETYRVRLWASGSQLCHTCSCPVGLDGRFCKHGIAVGLHVNSGPQPGERQDDVPAIMHPSDLRDYLNTQPDEELVALLLDQAARDRSLWSKLTLGASQHGQENFWRVAWKHAFQSAVAAYNEIGYRNPFECLGDIEHTIEVLRGRLSVGDVTGVIELAEFALATLNDCFETELDTEGTLCRLIEQVHYLHLEACTIAPPNPLKLAKRLVELELNDQHNALVGAAADYSVVLGQTGLAAHRRLVERAWNNVPKLRPGDPSDGPYSRSVVLRNMMRRYAGDDIDAQLEILTRDLSFPSSFIDIVILCRDAGRAEEALDWVQRGLEHFASSPYSLKLRELLSECLQDCGRHEDALALIWSNFADAPNMLNYRNLQRFARRAEAWPYWRDRAIDHIRAGVRVQSHPQGPVSKSTIPTDHSLLVEIFLAENDDDAAWREAVSGGCSRELWRELAELREDAHPQDAIQVYRQEVATALTNTGDDHYWEAIGYLSRMETLFDRMDDMDSMRELLTELRARHKRRRNLMKLLDAQGW